MKPHLREATTEDSDAIARLNHMSVAVTSPMDADRYQELLALSDFASVVEIGEEVVAFLLAISEGRPYENGNYQWFSNRLDRFLHIDRVVVDQTKRGVGLGKQLYRHLFQWATSHGISSIAAEFDIKPLNKASLSLHERHGFVELGSQVLPNGKIVSMRVKSLEKVS